MLEDGWFRIVGGGPFTAQVELRGVSKTYSGGVKAVSALDLTVGDDELFVIVGPSGSARARSCG